MLEKRLEKHIDLLMKRYPTLEKCRQDIIDGYLMLEECYSHDGKLLIAGMVDLLLMQNILQVN